MPPVIPPLQLKAGAERKKAKLQREAEQCIAPLERAVKYGMVTSEEKALLDAWEKYSVLLMQKKPLAWKGLRRRDGYQYSNVIVLFTSDVRPANANYCKIKN
ncbi:tail fiber assembly protein [Klebsiella michiganensis]|uniref:tail fiber assembly protein n=1 Tax=Klebsiella michiganensis TaxID=1134687 RepID=UPI003F505A01